MPARRYGQYCTLGRTLELVGDRWTLLIVRELLSGPLRFRDISSGLPGLSASLLTSRLRRLEADGLVNDCTGEVDRGRSYQLTALGLSLEPAVLELMRWGAAVIEPAIPHGEHFPRRWPLLLIRALVTAHPSPRLIWRIEVAPYAPLLVASDRNSANLTSGEEPDIVVSAPSGADLISAFRSQDHMGQAIAGGGMAIDTNSLASQYLQEAVQAAPPPDALASLDPAPAS